MRTTLDIDEDLLLAIKEIARRESRSAGSVVSDLLRRVLSGASEASVAEPASEYGFRPFPKRGGIVTNELIDELRDETGD